MEGFMHTEGPWNIIENGYAHLGKHIFANKERIACGVFSHNSVLIANAPEMLESLIKAYAELISISRLQDWHSDSFRTLIEEIEKTIEAATNMKIEEVLNVTARQDAAQ